MRILEDIIVEILASMSQPIAASRVLALVMTHSPTLAFSWEDFVDALCVLVSMKRIVENVDGYTSPPEVMVSLEELGL